ncbi:unnamed protein product [Rotaria socialis]|uniref:Methyltransferase domain-containing protein n=1 Tax=Rotaria socialis TaxID=392032 RepID=A0A818ILG2_9BILA|nr:unnamed protein product [Rotaria socialis]CAF3406399.1 unnamed protein product [Rotaria socialis]CAF3413814.1 unnamed protein product [Rotaria socialis]CAF3525432.1 unnamed protein product [Rotaria socialis]CAF4310472.1 unnamed protein product [Rotaria socialis]
MTSKDGAPPQELFFRLSGLGDSPWEIGQAQPVIIKLVEQGAFHGKVLDIGCGIGDNAIYIVTHANNISLTAIDLVPRAVEFAREKAEKVNVNIQFEVANMLDDLSKTNLKQHSYDVLLDSAIFHAFSNDDRLTYIKNLEYLIKPNGLYIQIVYSEKETREGGPRRIQKSDINELFSPANGWAVESIEDAVYEARPDAPIGPNGRAYLSFIRRNQNTQQ